MQRSRQAAESFNHFKERSNANDRGDNGPNKRFRKARQVKRAKNAGGYQATGKEKNNSGLHGCITQNCARSIADQLRAGENRQRALHAEEH